MLYILMLIELLVVGVIFWGIGARTAEKKLRNVNVCRAVVLDKYKAGGGGMLKKEKYVLVFLIGNDRVAFEIDENAFHKYELKESGILIYNKNSLVKFETACEKGNKYI